MKHIQKKANKKNERQGNRKIDRGKADIDKNTQEREMKITHTYRGMETETERA